MRLRVKVSGCPSALRTVTVSRMGVMGGAGSMNRALTQPWPTPPGFAVARM